jgi:hypothetical protein
LPIKKAKKAKQSEFVKESQSMISASEAFLKVTKSFLILLKADFLFEKEGKKIENWFELKFSDFVKELEGKLSPKNCRFLKNRNGCSILKKRKQKL